MTKWVSIEEINIISKALENTKADLSPSFYSGARCVLDRIYEKFEEKQQTERESE
jgi:hypothetical protein